MKTKKQYLTPKMECIRIKRIELLTVSNPITTATVDDDDDDLIIGGNDNSGLYGN